MDVDSFKFGKREKVIIFVHGDFGDTLHSNLSKKYNSKLSHDVSIGDIENKRIDILIVTDKSKFENLTYKYGIFLDRFFKIELNSLEHSIYVLLDKYFSLKTNQKGLVELLNEYKSLEKILQFFPPESIVVRKEYEDNDILVETISYLEGKQIYHGLTRDYRGETILFNKLNKSYHLLRGNLPVFEEYVTLTNVDDLGHTVVTPKFDGSLLNITFIHRDCEVFQLICSKPIQKYTVNSGIAFIGTKNLLITFDKIILERLMRAIKIPIENFLANLAADIREKSNVVFHFELVATDEYGGQCVTYDECFCVLIGMTYFNDRNKTFILPKDVNINCVDMKELKTRSEVEKYVSEQRNRMLNGDLSVEPEGFVIYSKNFIFKYKFPEYYVAHKPSCHFEEAIILSDRLNGNTRYCKLQTPITSKIAEVVGLLNSVYLLKLEERRWFIERNRPLIKRIDEEVNRLKFKKKKKFKICDYLMQYSKISPEHFKDYILEFLKAT